MKRLALLDDYLNLFEKKDVSSAVETQVGGGVAVRGGG